MLTLVSGLIVVIIDNTILNVALPSISQQLGASQAQLTGAILSYAVVFGSLQFTAGVLGDRWGRKRIFMIGLVLFGLASLAASQSQNPNQLVGFRALMAIGVGNDKPFEGEFFGILDAGKRCFGDGLPRVLRQHRFWVETFHVTDAAIHEQPNDIFGFGREMRATGGRGP